MHTNESIVYTMTDEAPALATRSFLPIIQKFTNSSNITIETKDISLSARILSAFSDYLNEDQRISDDLSFLGELVKEPAANIIKLPNISASIPQLKDAIEELQSKGYQIPNFPDEVVTEEDENVLARYNKIKGSAVNPVLREGNSDRRAPRAVKNYAKKNPHSMGAWSPGSKTEVATMSHGDFHHNEKSVTIEADSSLKIVLTTLNGETIILKDNINVLKGEVVDGTFMSALSLQEFLATAIGKATDNNLLLSFHLKATMMKVSDPIIFGYALKAYFKDVFNTYENEIQALDINPNNGLGSIIEMLEESDEDLAETVLKAFRDAIENGPKVAMVNSDEGITNLHVPSDVIIDASMPAMIRNSGQMWNKDGHAEDTLAIIPDSSYAEVYSATIDDCKRHGAYDPTTMGSVSNVGLMAKKAEEYGSHDKTFELSQGGEITVVDERGAVLMTHTVEKGDIWRMCLAKDAPIQNWIALAIDRAKQTGNPAVFWLNKERAHDAELIKKVETYFEVNNPGIDLLIMSVAEATQFSLDRIRKGEDTIAVTGNVLRDYLTDLFPILELGTSAKMLSIVPLMNGGGLFETGAGGSAPKHVQQFLTENHLRWDSLGEFLALSVSLIHYARVHSNPKAKVLGEALEEATEKLLDTKKGPSRKVNKLDNRGSHFYLALYWAEALAQQNANLDLKNEFETIHEALLKSKEETLDHLITIQGNSIDIGGYYFPEENMANSAMRPCKGYNSIINL
ncbi:NADP-dependent isocitrate dehydrogenase [Winogradskyella aurantiaca]|uniref:NADP-dependent isocitrate dehydrogenase n=1 Tax=Winogradskyella aurantiaca TaxID=2219558 RepID=UPI000E1D3FCD|nr:NADP-dependent isocitrate dehydrogenase [Winogradskyella aurantiaca]